MNPFSRLPRSQEAVIRGFLATLRQQRERPGTDHATLLAQPLLDAPDCACPLFLSKISAGFPSPADDYTEARLDLNERLVRHPAATFFVHPAIEIPEGEELVIWGVATSSIRDLGS